MMLMVNGGAVSCLFFKVEMEVLVNGGQACVNLLASGSVLLMCFTFLSASRSLDKNCHLKFEPLFVTSFG